ncbi:MAG: hypothetical protein IJ603_00450 [Bacteroidales bacterium]|nr:hypothetical protein [Bacteroidales bacterium]
MIKYPFSVLFALFFLSNLWGDGQEMTQFKTGYRITAIVSKNTFPAQSGFSVLWEDGSSMVGTISYERSTAYIEGCYRNSEEEIEGLFTVWNNRRKQLAAKSRFDLEWNLVSLSRYSTKKGPYDAELVKDQDHYHLCFSSESHENVIASAEADIPKDILDRYGYFAVDSLIRRCDEVQLTYADGQEFIGKAILREGFNDHSVIAGVLTEVPANNVLDIRFDKEKGDSSVVEIVLNGKDALQSLQFKRPISSIPEEGNLIYRALLTGEGVVPGTVLMTQQRSFEGEMSLSEKEDALEIIIKNGTISYPNGDKFVGNAGGKWIGAIPVDGTTFFSSGIQKTGDWFSSLKLNDWDKKSLAQLNSLSDILDEAQEMSTNNSNVRIYSGRLVEGPSDYYCGGRSLEAEEGTGKYSYYIENGDSVYHGPYSFNYSAYLSDSGRDKITVTGEFYNDVRVGSWRLLHRTATGSVNADLLETYRNGKLNGPFAYNISVDGAKYTITGQYNEDHLCGDIQIVFREGRAGFDISGYFDGDGWADGKWVLVDRRTKAETVFDYSRGRLTNRIGSSNVSIPAIFLDQYEPLPQYKKIKNAFK